MYNNVCTFDLSKAFDRMNHYALLIKLMDRKLPIQLLTIFELWFSISVANWSLVWDIAESFPNYSLPV